ncbi:hypothetical protein JTE90_004752 [Oedothorax gibbosus]|uniref:Uncharacterized protein n=1 Tax=Oedothorax gibbosus TaxID=931172 RepID=A0AAV6TUP8_9ARAC|nr:hypothetical protein JTE90_004752 [Oedothorax gibbosus]
MNKKETPYFSPNQKYAYYINDPDSRSKRLTIERVPLESLKSTQDANLPFVQANFGLKQKKSISMKDQVGSKYYPNAYSALKEKNFDSNNNHIQHARHWSDEKSPLRSNRKIYQRNPPQQFYQNKNYPDPKFAVNRFYASKGTRHFSEKTTFPIRGKKFDENQYIKNYLNYIREKNNDNFGNFYSNNKFMINRSVQPASTKHAYEKKSSRHAGKKLNENQAFRNYVRKNNNRNIFETFYSNDNFMANVRNRSVNQASTKHAYKQTSTHTRKKLNDNQAFKNYFMESNNNKFGNISSNPNSTAIVQIRSVNKAPWNGMNDFNHSETTSAKNSITLLTAFVLVLLIFSVVVIIISATYYFVNTYRKYATKSQRVTKRKRKSRKKELYKDINYHQLRKTCESSSESLNPGLNQEDFRGIPAENYIDSKHTFSSHVRDIQCCEMQFKNNCSNQTALLHSPKYLANFYETQCLGLKNEGDYSSENETMNNSESPISLTNANWILQNALPNSVTQSDTALKTTLLEEQDLNSAKYRTESSFSDGPLEYFKREDELSKSSKSFSEISNTDESERDFKDALEQLPDMNRQHNFKNDADLASDLDKSNLETVASLFRSSSSSLSDESQYYAHSYKHICYSPQVPI